MWHKSAKKHKISEDQIGVAGRGYHRKFTTDWQMQLLCNKMWASSEDAHWHRVAGNEIHVSDCSRSEPNIFCLQVVCKRNALSHFNATLSP